ncbi:MAG TPA: helix-turn-helix domain-containing protein [Candidatus Limnocylindrales bacterium]|nr:helix-turn-helix domain-containing protein [Candidatus Limnocylindrales bacterium]
MMRKFFVDRWVNRDPIVHFGMEVLGSSIRRARRARGWSQAKLASSAQLSPSTISKLESGTLQGMRLYTLARVIAALNSEIEVLDHATRAALAALPEGALARSNAVWLRGDDANYELDEADLELERANDETDRARREPERTDGEAGRANDEPDPANDEPDPANDAHPTSRSS